MRTLRNHYFIILLWLPLLLICSSGSTIIESSEKENPFMTLNQDQLPFQFALHQNFPNPFNYSTVIYFDLPVTIQVQLTLYTEEWENIRFLIDEVIPAGYHSYNFADNNLPSGEYYYTMQAGDYMAIQKMKCIK